MDRAALVQYFYIAISLVIILAQYSVALPAATRGPEQTSSNFLHYSTKYNSHDSNSHLRRIIIPKRASKGVNDYPDHPQEDRSVQKRQVNSFYSRSSETEAQQVSSSNSNSSATKAQQVSSSLSKSSATEAQQASSSHSLSSATGANGNSRRHSSGAMRQNNRLPKVLSERQRAINSTKSRYAKVIGDPQSEMLLRHGKQYFFPIMM